MKIKIYRELCIGVGTCVVLAENTFELDDELIAVLRSTESTEGRSPERSEGKKGKKKDKFEDILAAAKSCPVLAIILEDENGKQIYP